MRRPSCLPCGFDINIEPSGAWSTILVSHKMAHGTVALPKTTWHPPQAVETQIPRFSDFLKKWGIFTFKGPCAFTYRCLSTSSGPEFDLLPWNALQSLFEPFWWPFMILAMRRCQIFRILDTRLEASSPWSILLDIKFPTFASLHCCANHWCSDVALDEWIFFTTTSWTTWVWFLNHCWWNSGCEI